MNHISAVPYVLHIDGENNRAFPDYFSHSKRPPEAPSVKDLVLETILFKLG